MLSCSPSPAHDPRRTVEPMRRTTVLRLLPLAVLAACADAPALEVAGVAYAEAELVGLTPERREALADLTVFAAAVAGEGLEALGEPLVRSGRVRHLAELLRAQQAFDSLQIDESSLRLHYEGAPELELTVRHLIVMSERTEREAQRAEARAKAERALERIRAGEPFPEVAAEVSEEPGAEGRQGLLQPGREGSWVGEFWNAARALEPGQVSPVTETQYGFHVLRLEDRREIAFEEARNAVTLEVAAMIGVTPGAAPPVPEPQGMRGVAPPAALAPRLQDAGAADADTVAAWDGGALTLGELRDHLAGLDTEAWRAALAPDGGARLAEQLSLAIRWRAAADAARARGYEADGAHDAKVRQGWLDLSQAWAAILGFRPGSGPDALRRAALAALGATAQNAALARSEVLAHAPLLRRVGTAADP